MQILLASLLIAVLLPIISKMPLAAAMKKAGGYDNHNPRQQQATLEGYGARARAAHENAFEALCLYAPAVLAAIVTGAAGVISQYLAIGWVIFRVGYHLCYLADKALLRSTLWVLSYGCVIALLIMAMLS